MTPKYRWEEDKNCVVIEASLKAPQATDSQGTKLGFVL